MLLLLMLVFLGVFAVVALLLTASGTGASQQTEQTLTVLEAALATDQDVAADQIVDLRKDELLSAVPWLNRWLLKLEAGSSSAHSSLSGESEVDGGRLDPDVRRLLRDSCLSDLSADRTRSSFPC